MPSGSAARRSSCCAPMQSIVLGPGESRPIEGHAAEIKASTEDCDGRFAIFEATIGPDAGPPLHLHRRHLEAYYVVDGELEIRSGGGTIAAPAGSLTIAGNTIGFKAEADDTGGAFGLVEYTAAPGFGGPPAHIHRETADNPGAEPARFLSLVSPGGFEQYFRDLAQALGDGPVDGAT